MTIHKDIKSMRRRWPEFQLLSRSSRSAYWSGSLRPISQLYSIDIQYRVNRKHVGSEFQSPRVTVVAPLLRRRPELPSEPIPHHYPNSDHPQLPFLCLYDPEQQEWHPGLGIATTIVPWTIDWLACYEGWLATGEWTGGGRDHAAA